MNTLFLVAALVTGLLTAFLLHGLTWTLRRKSLTFTVVIGAVSALGLTWFFSLFRDSDIAREVFLAMLILDAIALGLGILQAASLRIPWWKGVLAVFFEMALAFLAGAAVNLTMQKYIPWFAEHVPGLDVYAVINTFLWTMIVAELLLAVVRPLLVTKRPDSSAL